MSLKVTGTITKILPLESGTSKAGKEWQKQSFLLDSKSEYNNLYCFEVFGSEKVENFNKYNKEGQSVEVEFNVSTNEWKDKYFTSLQAWKIMSQNSDVQNTHTPQGTVPNVTSGGDSEDDNLDLPF